MEEDFGPTSSKPTATSQNRGLALRLQSESWALRSDTKGPERFSPSCTLAWPHHAAFGRPSLLLFTPEKAERSVPNPPPPLASPLARSGF